MIDSEIRIYFERLGLPESATHREIKEAFKDLVKVWHPDRFQNDPKLRAKTEEKLKEINEAYQRVLDYRTSNPIGSTSRPPSKNHSKDDVKETEKRTDTPAPFSHIRDAAASSKTFFILTLLTIAGIVMAFTAYFYFNSRHILSASNSNLSETPVSKSPAGNKGLENDLKPQEVQKTISKPDKNGPNSPYFTLDSTRNDVVRVQGTPDSMDGNSYAYKFSTVYFQDDRVVGWSNLSKNLQVKLLSDGSNAKSFTLGSSRDDVVSVQGTPDSVSKDSYQYAFSTIYFRGEKVTGWSNLSHNLKVRILTNSRTTETRYSIGATKDEVINIQGTPDSVSDSDYGYGFSTVYFKNGRVSSWSNIDGKLKVVMKATP